MHPQAMQWLHANAVAGEIDVLDIGGRNINGSALDAYPDAACTVLDIRAGDGVDIVANAADWQPDKEYDVVVCAEVFEHTDEWRSICATCFLALKQDGLLVLTMAGPGRTPHSAIDGNGVRPEEYYGNVDPDDLRHTLESVGFVDIVVDQQLEPCDVRATAVKP